LGCGVVLERWWVGVWAAEVGALYLGVVRCFFLVFGRSTSALGGEVLCSAAGSA
jgi:hypothetical protein